MELLTDFLAILGFFMLVLVTPTIFKVKNIMADIYLSISFALIAASVVLGI